MNPRGAANLMPDRPTTMATGGHMLDTELQTYEAQLARLLGQDRGKYVLIKGERVVDVFSSIDDALKQGYELFEAEPFLVRQILEVQVPQNFTS